jgi:hypothetical protein
MPFTPFHLGPGAAFKAIGGKHFSFMVFGGTQVLMDIEPLVAILRGSPVLHGVTHTILGALVLPRAIRCLGSCRSKDCMSFVLLQVFSVC